MKKPKAAQPKTHHRKTAHRAKTHGGGRQPAPKPHHHPVHHHQRPRKAPKPPPRQVVKKAHHHKRRGLALGEGVACCSAEALAASLRLLGVPVGDEDVLALYWRTAADADAGASISATLEAASRFGLAGIWLGTSQPTWAANSFPAVPEFMRPASWGSAARCAGEGRVPVADDVATMAADRIRAPGGHPGLDLLRADAGHALILGVTLPGGPHAVLADGGTWWSWGEPWCPCQFPDAVIEEAWLVDWEV